MNEFKVSVLRNFGSENISFTSTINSDKLVLSESEITQLINQTDSLVSKAFTKVCEREIREKEELLAQSDKRKEANETLAKKIKSEHEGAEKLNEAGSKLKGYSK